MVGKTARNEKLFVEKCPFDRRPCKPLDEDLGYFVCCTLDENSKPHTVCSRFAMKRGGLMPNQLLKEFRKMQEGLTR